MNSRELDRSPSTLNFDGGAVSRTLAERVSVKLDWTDASIEQVERILGKMHGTIPVQKPSEEVIWNFAKGFGSYTGEVFRKNHGGEWGMITDGGNTFPGLRWNAHTLFWPWGRVHKRLVEGDENNV